MQGSVYWYLSRNSEAVAHYAPYILLQLGFAFVIDILISALRYKSIRIGFSVFPIVLSINLFLWFKPSYFYLQLLTITLAITLKHVWTWTWDGKRSHIFNPSGIALAVASVIALIMGARQSMLLESIIDAYQASRPDVFLFVLAVGLISQSLGRVIFVSAGTLMTLFSLSVLSIGLTGMPLMNHPWIDPSVFVGITLLVTDPSTTPKRWPAQLVAGGLYAVALLGFYGLLSALQEPGYFAKVLAVPLVNLTAPYFDRWNWCSTLGARLRILGQPLIQATLYASFFLLFLPKMKEGIKSPSWLGQLGGAEWAQTMRR